MLSRTCVEFLILLGAHSCGVALLSFLFNKFKLFDHVTERKIDKRFCRGYPGYSEEQWMADGDQRWCGHQQERLLQEAVGDHAAAPRTPHPDRDGMENDVVEIPHRMDGTRETDLPDGRPAVL